MSSVQLRSANAGNNFSYAVGQDDRSKVGTRSHYIDDRVRWVREHTNAVQRRLVDAYTCFNKDSRGGAVGAAMVAQVFGLVWAMLPLGLAVAATVAARKKHWLWMIFGIVYLGIPVAALAHYRGDTTAGLILVFWLVALVAATDIGGYFVGRTVGGPKLWPAISPGKTWSGTLGGWGLAAVVGLGFGLFAPGWELWPTVTLSLLLAASSQIGDLAESWLKRRQGVKDSSRLIPGHGGILDRLDGLVAAVNVYVLTLVF